MNIQRIYRSINKSGREFDDFFKPWNKWVGNGGFPRKSMSMPAVNVLETKDEYKVSVAAQGLKKKLQLLNY